MTRRQTKEQELGELGEAQVSARFKKYKWPNGRVEPDLGEDLLIRIYEQGHATGLTFLAQVKSTDDLDAYTLKKSGDISYPIEIKDLLHWEVSTTPVFLFVWDVTRESGVWVAIADAIKALDEGNPGWREIKKKRSEPEVKVRVPASQMTSDEGLVILRLFVLKHCAKQIESWYLKNFSIDFPQTPEGQGAMEEFLRAQNTGESLTLPGEFMKVSERDARLLGPINSWETTISMGTEPSKEPFPVKLEVKSPEGNLFEIPYLDLRVVKKGRKQTTFANYHAATPFSPERKATPFCFELVDGQTQDHLNINLSTQGSCPIAEEVRAALPFLNAFARGGQFRWTALANPHPHQRKWHDLSNTSEGFHALYGSWIEALCVIQEKFGCTFTLPDWRISSEDAATLEHVLAAIATGRVFSSDEEVHLQLVKAKVLRQNKKQLAGMFELLRRTGGHCDLTDSIPNDCRQLLGVEVCLGQCQRRSNGRISGTVEDLERAIAKAKANDEISVELLDVFVVYDYSLSVSSSPEEEH